MNRKMRALAAAVLAAGLLLVPGTAYAQPSGEVEPPATVVVEPTPTVDEPTLTIDPEPAPTVDPEPTVEPDPEPTGTVAPEPTGTVAPDPTTDPTGTVTPDPTGTVEPTTPAPTGTVEPTAPTTAPTDPAAPTTNIEVDVEIDDHSDHSVHIENNATFYVEGDRYSSVYVYRDVDGRTYRGWDLDCTDFDTRADAQRALNATVGDPYWLDGDGDGLACEIEQGEFTRDTATSRGVRTGGQVAVYPSGSVATGLAA